MKRHAPDANWPLWLGGLIVLCVLWLALEGPRLAPRDPLQENFIVQNPSTGEFVKPPLAAFTVPGFPLGTDHFGRDLYSQLLWAVRPTLTLVLVVAALRLVVGIVVGLASGWSAGRWGRILDALISAALAAPVLFVALVTLAAVGIRLGLWAFVLGLSVTGWAEAARLVREQTRTIKGQPFVEAARAMGAPDSGILLRHILPHVMPMVWMLMAFEISSALLVTAGLGFLGYFSNAVWIPLGDWSGIRAAGRPELGQMLGASAQNWQQEPWGMLAAGSLIFLAVLGFNLLGEGLRLQLSPERRRRPATPLAAAWDNAGKWIEDRMYDQVTAWRRTAPTLAAIAALLAVIVGGGWILWQSVRAASGGELAVTVPGGHLWAAEQHDAQGTLYAHTRGPVNPSVLWEFEDETHMGFSGGPAVAADGTVYVASNAGKLYALTPDGAKVWEADLPAPSVGAPALGASGDIYVTDQRGGLSAVRPDGNLRWTVAGPLVGAGAGDGLAALSGPIADADETIYYATSTSLLAVTPDGDVRWKVSLPTFSISSPLPRLSANGQYLFFEDIVLDPKDGATLFSETVEPLDKFFVGTEGGIYLRSQARLHEWRPTEAGAVIEERAKWDASGLGLGFRFPRDAGIVPDGRIWVLYSSDFEFAKLLWLGQNGEAQAPTDYPFRPSRMIAVDEAATAYVCGHPMEPTQSPFSRTVGGVECRAHKPGAGEPVWDVALEGGAFPVGGALVAGRLYVTTSDGVLFAIGDGRQQ
jgi:ABC-type dipeptide/oligopeptide/nickel transport system permease subunit/outer membrane protein assembly factor BamB